MAFSGGFHPHPKISYANGAPTGTASEAEYFEISVTEPVVPGAVQRALDEALPDGLDVIDVVTAGPGSLADRLEASDWLVTFRETSVSELEEAVTAYLACERAEVSRVFKTGPKTFDTRSAVVLMSVDVAEAESGPHVRTADGGGTPHRPYAPDDILTALRAVSAFAPPVPTPGDPTGARPSMMQVTGWPIPWPPIRRSTAPDR